MKAKRRDIFVIGHPDPITGLTRGSLETLQHMDNTIWSDGKRRAWHIPWAPGEAPYVAVSASYGGLETDTELKELHTARSLAKAEEADASLSGEVALPWYYMAIPAAAFAITFTGALMLRLTGLDTGAPEAAATAVATATPQIVEAVATSVPTPGATP